MVIVMKLVKALLIPYLKRFFLMLFSVVLVGAFGCGILIGLRNAYHSLNQNIHSLLDECGYPDLYVETIGNIETKYLDYLPDDFQDYMGFQEIEYRNTYTTTFTKGDLSYSCRLLSYDDKSILKHHLVSGSFKENGISMEYYFAKSNGFSVGDTFVAKMPDGSLLPYTIDALIVSAETSQVKADPYSISSSRDFAYVYVPRSSIVEHSSQDYFNQILINFKPGQKKNLDDTLSLLKEYIQNKTGSEITEEDVKSLKNNVAYVTTYEESEVIDQFNSALKAIDLITILAPVVFFVVVMVVTALFLFQIVKQCRKDIGIMRALGESNKSISLVFLSLGFVVGFFSWVFGIGIGTIFTLLANEAYGSALKLFPQPLVLHPSAIFISLAIMITVNLLTSLFASFSITKIKPVEAMKALPPSNNETPFLTKTVFKRAPIPLKVSISQTLRNIRRYILSGICLLASGMLIFVALSIGESKTSILAQLFETRIQYNIQVYFDNLPTQEEMDTLLCNDENILEQSLIKYLPSEMVNTRNDKKTNGLINGIKNEQNLLKVIDDDRHVIEVPREGIILSTYHAHQLEAKVGDIIMANDVSLEVKAISNEYIYQVSYTSFDAYEPSKSRGSLLAKVKNEKAFFDKYKDVEHVTYIAYTDVVKGEFTDRLAPFEISSRLLTFMAIVIGFLIVFNMMQTNLKEQKRTFATMRTLGYQRRSISLANLFSSLFQYIVAMLLAIPLGILLSKGLLQSISIPSQIHPFPHSWVMYVFSVVFVLIFLLLSHFLVMSSMKRWNLPESVKERE